MTQMNLMAVNTVKAGIKDMPGLGQKIQYTRNGKRRPEKIAAGNNPQPFVEESFGFFEDFRVFSCLKSKNFVLLLIQVEEPIGSSPVSSLMTFCILMTLMILMTFDISRYDPGDHPGDILCRLRVHHLCLTLVSHHLSCQPPRLVRPLFCNRIVLRKLRGRSGPGYCTAGNRPRSWNFTWTSTPPSTTSPSSRNFFSASNSFIMHTSP